MLHKNVLSIIPILHTTKQFNKFDSFTIIATIMLKWTSKNPASQFALKKKKGG